MKYKLTLFSLAFFVLLISLSFIVHAFESEVYHIGIEIPLTDDDAGEEETPSNGDTSGGGGGGGNDDSSYWECGEWSECIDKIQTRTCVNFGENLPNRTETKECLFDFISSSNSGTNEEEENQESSSTNFLTGAIIGGIEKLSKSKLSISILFILIIAILFMLIGITRKKATKLSEQISNK